MHQICVLLIITSTDLVVAMPHFHTQIDSDPGNHLEFAMFFSSSVATYFADNCLTIQSHVRGVSHNLIIHTPISCFGLRTPCH